MPDSIRALFSVLGRLCLVAIFALAAVGQKIPKFAEVAALMDSKGVPYPQVALAGAIAFLILGSLMVLVGYYARIGALLLAVFLVLATYYFHAFWAIEDEKLRGEQMLNFLKNLSLFGAMLFIIANGSGAGSLDARQRV
jgi:putative oxidoreductase